MQLPAVSRGRALHTRLLVQGDFDSYARPSAVRVEYAFFIDACLVGACAFGGQERERARGVVPVFILRESRCQDVSHGELENENLSITSTVHG